MGVVAERTIGFVRFWGHISPTCLAVQASSFFTTHQFCLDLDFDLDLDLSSVYISLSDHLIHSRFALAVYTHLSTSNDMSSSKTNAQTESLMLWFLLPVILSAFIINLWLSFVRSYDHHRDHAGYVTIEEEDWLLADSDIDEDAPVPSRCYNTIKEGPLSPEEVGRLIDIIRADEVAPKGISRTVVPGLKRKAGDEASPIGGGSSDEGSRSPKARKLRIETDFGTSGRWVSENCRKGSSIHEENLEAPSAWGEYEFTFRASPPNRAIRSIPKLRQKARLI